MDAVQREQFSRLGYLVVDDALSPALVEQVSGIFAQRLAAENVPSTACAWYLDTEDAGPAGRELWTPELVCPPKVAAVLGEIFSEPRYGHVAPGLPVGLRGRFRLDHDNAHWVGPFDPARGPSEPELDFPPMPNQPSSRTTTASPHAGHSVWDAAGIIRDGLHGGPPLYHVSVMYPLRGT